MSQCWNLLHTVTPGPRQTEAEHHVARLALDLTCGHVGGQKEPGEFHGGISLPQPKNGMYQFHEHITGETLSHGPPWLEEAEEWDGLSV